MPMCHLERFKKVFPVDGIVTKQAQSDAYRLGFDEEDIEQVIWELRPEHFYKSMPSQRVPGTWQDVYKTTYRRIPLYIKIQLRESGESSMAVVVAFKADESVS